jgi:predicted P-loop ATPase
LKWDGEPRLDSWLVVYFGAKGDPIYLKAVGSKWMISAVARADKPGVQVDHTLSLEGKSGLGKSTAFRILAVEDDWFTDQVREFGSKDAAQQLSGIWIVELAELAAVVNLRTEIERVKAFLTQRDDRFRVPYGRRPAKFLRSCVFAATTNADEPFRDEAGNRRFWPARCTAIDLEKLKADREQLWAEACARYKNGEPWHITDPKILKIAEEEQKDRVSLDAWHEDVMRLARLDLAAYGGTAVSDILTALGVSKERQGQNEKNRVVRCLRFEAWEKFHSGPREARQWRYRPERLKETPTQDPDGGEQ